MKNNLRIGKFKISHIYQADAESYLPWISLSYSKSIVGNYFPKRDIFLFIHWLNLTTYEYT